MNCLTGKELGKEFSYYVNCHPAEYKDFVNEIVNDDLTLQQSSIRLIFAVIKGMAAEGKYTDARNEASVAICRKIIKQFGSELCFPLI